MDIVKIIGIDPGLGCTGWGIISKAGKQLAYVDSGKIKTNSSQQLSQRLHSLHQELSCVLELHRPNLAAIEETFVNKNPRSSLSLCHARGALLLTLTIFNIKNIYHYSANHIKKTVTGNGHAEKHQMINVIKYSLKDIKEKEFSHDIADALAVALCHAYRVNDPVFPT